MEEVKRFIGEMILGDVFEWGGKVIVFIFCVFVGVVVVIIFFNVFLNLVCYKIGLVFVVGNSVILKLVL